MLLINGTYINNFMSYLSVKKKLYFKVKQLFQVPLKCYKQFRIYKSCLFMKFYNNFFL